jgi:biopolymer transport protein TolR
VELPRAELGALSAEEAPLVVSLTRGGTLYLNEEAISRQGLVARLRTTVDERGEKPVYIRADESLPYGEVVSVMAAIHEAGIRQVGMVTQLPPVGG